MPGIVPNDVQASFGVVSTDEPVRRLSDSTRLKAARALGGEFAGAMREVEGELDIEPYPDHRHSNAYVAAAVREAARLAPIRIEPGDRVVGAATLPDGARHRVPMTDLRSVSHTTIDFEHALSAGYRGLRDEIRARQARGDLDGRGNELLESMLVCLDAAGIWHRRHVDLLEDRMADASADERDAYGAVLGSLRNVPEGPPGNFREAVQSLWFMFAFQRLCGNWSGIGRIDKMLGPFLEADLSAGHVTLDDARELIAHFWINGAEWATLGGGGSGDAQFYQNIVLGGIDESGREVTNAVTYLVLDVVEELHISDFPIAVRVSRRTPERLWRRIAEVQRRGGGIVAIYNEDLIIRSLVRFGYALEEARNFANDGCWEIMIPGKTVFSYVPFDALLLLQEVLGLSPDSRERASSPDTGGTSPASAGLCPADYPDFEALYAAFRERLAAKLNVFHERADGWASDRHPAPLVSLFVRDCIERGRGYYDRGPRYCVQAPHAGGLPDVANSLLVIRRLVYEEQAMSLPAFLDIARADWEGHEALRLQTQRRFELYGNGNPDADSMMRRVYDDFVELAGSVRERSGVLRPPGISTFGRELEYRAHRTATVFGRRRGDILATNFAPTPGSDRLGPTAVIRSYCSVDFEKLPNGTPLELEILPSVLKGEAGLQALVGLLRTFVELGGVFLHIDVVDSDLLRDAQAHPGRYPNLVVRISGWSARFATLNRDWQEMVIRRTQQE